MERIAQVLVNIPTRRLNKVFSYTIPEQWDFLDIGWRVIVPFGSRRTEGFITGIEWDDVAELKEIAEVWDTEPWFDAHMMTIARWLSDYYLCSLAETLRLFVPGGTSVVSQIIYKDAYLESGDAHPIGNLPENAAALLEWIRLSGTVMHKSLIKKFGQHVVKELRLLLKQKLITKELGAVSKVKAQFRTQYKLAVSVDKVETVLASLSGRPAQRRAIELLSQKATIEDTELPKFKITRPVMDKVVASGLVAIEKIRVMRNSYLPVDASRTVLKLSAEQQAALGSICSGLQDGKFHPYLLHGITGSGKTEVYIEAAAHARLHQNRNVIVLVPEIALTSQIVYRFKARFGEDVTVIHSKLSLGERNDAWEKMRRGECGIVIGARSAVFAPLPDIGLIILDEEHEFTYKQEETPRYHAREVALMRARLSGAVVVLGSATPSVESYHKCQTGEYTLLTMPTRVSGVLPTVTVVDMREQLKQGNRSVISPVLHETLAAAISRGEQAIVLLNRRGYATFVLCRECGYVMQCEHCSVSLVYHAAGKTLKCHYCQRRSHVPDQCPACLSRYIRYFGSGTQKVEDELYKLLPGARILRMDQDTTGGRFSHERILAEFAAGRHDILLGTQMVAKGHDIKNVTVVGVISADTALNLPDFRAAEKTFALVMQAAGRAGRGDQPGRVIVQTYNPEHYAVETGAKHDYHSFYQEEISFRKALGYPPFSRLLKLTLSGPNESGVRRQADEVIKLIQSHLAGQADTVQILGPFPAAVSKVDDVFRVNILIKAIELAVVQQTLTNLELNAKEGTIIDVDPLNVM